eukprot:751795-Prorocentrum_minimum.AAC.1
MSDDPDPCSIVVLHDTVFHGGSTGMLRAFFRDRQARWVFTTTSSDDGSSWSLRHHHLPVPNNNAGIQ